MPLLEAIHQGGRMRLRSILVTSLPTVVTLAPVFFTEGLGAELQRPLALAVIGGLAVGTLSSLYLVPVLYVLLFSGHPRVGKSNVQL
jgi:multidrug efflux pump subunit AcrB